MSPVLSALWRIVSGRKTVRWYRRTRWHRDPAWVARTHRKPPLPDVILYAQGQPALPLALWEVSGPRDKYTLNLEGKVGGALVHDFPAAGFINGSGETVHWEGLPGGRYWAVLLAWKGTERVPICKVPFRIYPGESKFWRWYEGWFMRLWQEWFGGKPMPEAPQSP